MQQSAHPVYTDDDNQYPFAGTWNKVRGFLEENIQLFQGTGHIFHKLGFC